MFQNSNYRGLWLAVLGAIIAVTYHSGRAAGEWDILEPSAGSLADLLRLFGVLAGHKRLLCAVPESGTQEEKRINES